MNEKYLYKGVSLWKYLKGNRSLYVRIVRYLKQMRIKHATDAIIEKFTKAKAKYLYCADGEKFADKCRRLGLNRDIVYSRYIRKGKNLDDAINWFLSGKARKHIKIQGFKNAAEYCHANKLDYARFMSRYKQSGGNVKISSLYASKPPKKHKKKENKKCRQ